ncbi:MAG: hypothetical protein V4454_20745 [Pseudomonadota bacterium]
MSLLTRYLTGAHHAALSRRVTANGVRLEDVIRSGLRHPDSTIGVYAPDSDSYAVFRELFEPILENFHAPSLSHRTNLACIQPAAVVSTRIRVARNLAGHAFPAGMSGSERLDVEQKITQACRSLAPGFEGTILQLKDIPRDTLDDMVANRLAFGPDDKYMAAAGIHDDWPLGRSVFNTHARQLSVWINEEDHLRVAVVLPGACASACHALMASVMSRLAAQLDFCEDAQLGFLTSCPSNAGSAMRVSFRVDLRLNASQQALLAQLESAGILEIRSPAGEHAPREGGLVDIGFRNRGGIPEMQMLQDMDLLFMKAALPA